MRSLDVQKSLGAINGSSLDAVLIDSGAVLCSEEIEAAHELFKMSFSDGTNISKNKQSEILLYLACETHVKNAIEKAGAKDGEPAVLAVFGKSGKIDFDKLYLEKFAGKFLGCDKSELKKRIERMALSRI